MLRTLLSPLTLPALGAALLLSPAQVSPAQAAPLHAAGLAEVAPPVLRVQDKRTLDPNYRGAPTVVEGSGQPPVPQPPVPQKGPVAPPKGGPSPGPVVAPQPAPGGGRGPAAAPGGERRPGGGTGERRRDRE